MSDMTGKTIGQYEIHEEIGRGGMATVYRATQTSIGRTVAIKILPPNFMQDRTFLERFNREVQVIALLQHRSILPVYDYGEDDGQPYIVMAFMEGGTLSDRIRKGPMTFNDALRTITQIAEGLDYAHSQGIIHRDFKPSNVLLDGQGNAYLADFGIAKVSEATMQLTGSGVIGTPAYMAPEMFRKGDLTTAADVYALGITLYQMLTGHLPYEAETPVQFMMSHVNDPVPDVLSERPELPDGVHSVIEKAMAKAPENRFQTAASMAEAFLMADSGGTMPMVAQDELAQPVVPTPIASSTPREAERVSTPQPRPKRRGISLWLVFGLLLAAGAIIVVGGILVGAIILTGNDRNEQQGAFTDARRDGESERVNEDITDNEPTPDVPTPVEVAVEITPTFTPIPTIASTPTNIPAPVVSPGDFDATLLLILSGHTGGAEGVAWSPNGLLLATGSDDNSVFGWDAAAGTQLAILSGHTFSVTSLSWSPDGVLASGGRDDAIIIWDLTSTLYIQAA